MATTYTSSYSYSTNLTDAGVSQEVYDKLGAGSISEGALTEFSKKFTIGPTDNEFLANYAFGDAAHDFHYLDYTSTDIVIVRQSMMLAFYLMVNETNKTIEPTPRVVKDILIKPTKVSL